MTTSRSYQDACGMAHALDLVGERWAMHVLRELMLGPKRYTDLQRDLPGISTTVLRDRLAGLEAAGLLIRRRLDPPAASWVYELTQYGADLEPVITVLGRWGARSPLHRPDLPLSLTSFVLSLRTNLVPERAAALDDGSWVLVVDGVALAAQVADGHFTVVPGAVGEPLARLEGGPEALASVVYGARDLSAAVAAGDLRMSGDEAAARALLGLFALPEKAVTG